MIELVSPLESNISFAKQLEQTYPDISATQVVLNKEFPSERRNELLSNAPKDVKGRPVRFYRRMKWEFFLNLVKTGNQTAFDYFNPEVRGISKRYSSLEAPIEIPDFYSLLIRYSRYLNKSEEIQDYFYKKFFGISSGNTTVSNLVNDLEILFPQVPRAEIEQYFTTPNYQNVLNFISKYIPLEFLKSLHTGESLQKFSPLLSLSVGGVIDLQLGNDLSKHSLREVYVEFVIPTEKIIAHPEGMQSEKEVLAHQIDAKFISRAFVSEEQIIKEVINDETCPLGQYATQNKTNPRFYDELSQTLDLPMLIDSWSRTEKTNDCLPVPA